MSLTLARPISTAISIQPWGARTALLLVVAAAFVAGFAVTDAPTAHRAVSVAGPDLTRVLRGMALLKLTMASAAVAAIVWRLGTAIRPIGLAAYLVAGAAMAGGPGLIWDMDYIRTGALLLHGGLAVIIVMLWRDPAVASRLATLVAARRAALRT